MKLMFNKVVANCLAHYLVNLGTIHRRVCGCDTLRRERSRNCVHEVKPRLAAAATMRRAGVEGCGAVGGQKAALIPGVTC